MKNAFSIDLEYWWCNEYMNGHSFDRKDHQIVDSTNLLLDILDKYDVSATFFVLGMVAEEYPELIKDIHEKGHEIGSHGYSHKKLSELGKDEFEEEIKKTNRILRKITGERPRGFRAPSFSISDETKWAFDVLEKHKFEYDSSIFPVKTRLYGVPEAPVGIYRPSKEELAAEDPDGKILEFPLSVHRIANQNIPISGGFYLRTLPLLFLKYGIKNVNKERPFILYLHPRELSQRTPKLPVSWKSRFIIYHGVSSTLNKMEALINEFKFRTVGEVLDGM